MRLLSELLFEGTCVDLDSEKFSKEKIAKPGILWYPYSYHTNKERTPERLSKTV